MYNILKEKPKTIILSAPSVDSAQSAQTIMAPETVEEPALLILAAGMGSRFGGDKQIASVGPSGERIIDYSIFDAIKAGFKHIVFIIKEESLNVFEAEIGSNIKPYASVYYVFQKPDDLPLGFALPDERVKPWGTGHALLACRHLVKGPCAVINADDYYGRDTFKLLYDFLSASVKNEALPKKAAMVGYKLGNTMTENGSVSRGVCSVDEDGMLIKVDERTHIEWVEGIPAFKEGDNWVKLKADTPVSMNCWALPCGVIGLMEEKFEAFLEENGENLKSEFHLPGAVDSLVKDKNVSVKVMSSSERWYGMTYAEDRETVVNALKSMTEKGVYPKNLWG